MRAGPHYKLFTLDIPPCPFTGVKLKKRHVQEPKVGLKQIHKRLQVLLGRVTPPMYAHGAIEDRSYKSNAAAHAGYKRVATFDLADFYSKTSKARVFDFFRHEMLCEPDIAGLLSDLACFNDCLPTGSPLSPLMSIYANKQMFDKLDLLASQHGLTFTSYIDDITFSGASLPRGLPAIVEGIVMPYGHHLRVDKTAIFRRSQVKHVTGVVISGGVLAVPNSRFFKARKIGQALSLEPEIQKKLKLAQKLAGLLGEAAHIDPTYRLWAKSSYRDLASLNRRMLAMPVSTTSRKLLVPDSDQGLPF